MKSFFRDNNVKTAFLFRSDLSLTNSFSTLLDELPPGKNSSIEALNNYKTQITSKNYRSSYRRVILNIIDRLIVTISNPGTSIQTFNNLQIATTAKLTVNTVYQDYLDGLNDGSEIDPVMLMILDEIKSASIS